MLSVSGLTWQVADKAVLKDITVDIPQGGFLAIVGPNGAGKSSLLRCCMGWTTPTAGTVSLAGTPVAKLRSRDRAKHLAWLPQRPVLAESLPVLDVVANARFRFSESRQKSRQTAHEALQTFGVSALGDKLWHTLSGGEVQRVNLASLWAQQADLWLLDEPANHLDPAVQQSLYRQLTTQWRDGQTTALITHNLNLLLAAVPEAEQTDVQILGLKDGAQAFLAPLDSPDLPRKMGELYEVAVEEITAFGVRQWVFGERS